MQATLTQTHEDTHMCVQVLTQYQRMVLLGRDFQFLLITFQCQHSLMCVRLYMYTPFFFS